MRKRLLNIILTACAAILLLAGCNKSVDTEFVSSSYFCLKVKDEVVFRYDPLTCQVAFNRSNGEFRVHTDNMSDYYCVTLRSIPTSENQKVKGSITWTEQSSIKSKKDLSFIVEKVDRSGRLWLWCRKERIGAVVQTLD